MSVFKFKEKLHKVHFNLTQFKLKILISIIFYTKSNTEILTTTFKTKNSYSFLEF